MKLSDLVALNERFPDNCGRRETIGIIKYQRYFGGELWLNIGGSL